MHIAEQLSLDMFGIDIAGQRVPVSELLPRWTAADRLGILVWHPYGAIGASHLIQVASTQYYDVRPWRRDPANPVYPETYVFHVGRRWGDHNTFDAWPPRKETVVEADPHAVLRAVNDRAITRLAVPTATPVPLVHRQKEDTTALDRIISAFAYSPTGRVDVADVHIHGLSRATEVNVRGTLNPERVLKQRQGAPAGSRLNDPEFDALMNQRMQECTPEDRQTVAASRRQHTVDGVVTETYRRIPVEQALAMLVPAEVRP